MPRRCSVPGCRSNYDTEKIYTPSFTFPKDETRRKKWICNINRKDFAPGSSASVCILHFDERFIIREDKFVQKDGTVQVIPREKLMLTDDAYPTQFPNQPHYLSQTLPKKRKTPCERQKEIEERDNDIFLKWCEADCITSLNDIKLSLKDKLNNTWFYKCEDNSVFVYKVETTDYPKVTVSLKIFENLAVKLHYENVPVDISVLHFVLGNDGMIDKWSKFESVISFLNSFELKTSASDQKLKSINLLMNEIHDIVVDDNEICASKLHFLLEQINLAFVKRKSYSSETLLWASKIYFSFPAAYLMVKESNLLTVPHPSYLRNLTRSLATSGELDVDGNHVTYLKNKVQMLKEHERYVNVLLDEIYITAGMNYKGGNIVGVSDNCSVLSEASTVQTFMITSLFSKYKDVIALIPVKNITAEQLYGYAVKVLQILHNCGFIVICMISDNNSVNRNMFSLMCGGQLATSIPNPADETKKMFLLFDTTHLIKSIRNNWLNQSLTNQTFFFPNPENMKQIKVASVLHLKKIYDFEKNKIVKQAPKLNKKVLFPTSTERQNVQNALSIFDETNAVALECNSENFGCDFLQTRDFIVYILKWWKIVNCRSPLAGKHLRDPYRDPITSPDHANIVFLKHFSMWIKKWKEFSHLSPEMKATFKIPMKGGMLSRETELALSHSTETLIEVINYVFQEIKPRYILLGKFQTDSLEARFGQYRQMSGGNYNISLRQVLESEKKLKILSLIKLHSKAAGEFTISSLQCENSSEKNSDDLEIAGVFSEVKFCLTKSVLSDSVMPVLIYIAGYVAFKVKNGIVCEECISVLCNEKKLEWECTCPDAFRYITLCDRGGLKWPKEFTVKIVGCVYEIFEILISERFEEHFLKHSHQKNLVVFIAKEKIALLNIVPTTVCTCGVSTDVLAKKCYSIATNIFINNYCKAKNDKIEKKQNKRKLSTLSSKGGRKKVPS